MGTKVYDNALDLITFSRASRGTALRRIGYGPELVTNGTFDTDSDWTKGTGVTISGGVASFSSTPGGSGVFQSVSIPVGVYLVSFEVSDWVSGGLLLRIRVAGGTIYATASTANSSGNTVVSAILNVYGAANHIEIISPGGVASPSTLSLDNVSVKEVLFDRASDPLVLFNHPTNIPRIEYAADGTVKGLLIEEQRTNNVTNSEACEFGAEVSGTVTTSTTPAPFGLSSVVKRVQASVLNSGARLSVSVLVGGDNHSSVYVRSRTGADQNLKITSSGTVGATQVAPASGDWVRLGATASLGAGSRDMRVLSVGDAIDLDIALPQLESGSFATSYISTSGSTATRSADIASIPVSAFGYNQKAGTVVVEAETISTSQVNHADLRIKSETGFAVTDSGSRVGSYAAGSYVVFASATNVNMKVDSVITEGQMYKAGYTIKENDAALSVDGSSIVADTSTTFSSYSAALFELGKGANYLNGHIKSIQYYPRRLTNTQLQELTA